MIRSITDIQKGTSNADKVKSLIGIAVGLGADAAISMLLKSHLPPVKGWKKLGIGLGIFVLSMKVGEECEEYFRKVWEDTVKAFREARTETNDIPVEEVEIDE